MAVVAAIALGAAVLAEPVPELEPNESRANATRVALSPGQSLGGTTTGATTQPGNQDSVDYFLLSVPASPGVTLYRLAVATTGTAGHTIRIQGLNQSAGVIQPADIQVQSSTPITNPPRHVAWYALGPQPSRLYIRVSGAGTTTAQYEATLSAETVTPVALPGGPLEPGTLTITTAYPGQNVGTDLWVYSAEGEALAGFGNDNATMSVTQSTLIRTFPVGRYLLAMTDANLANHLPSPVDDGRRDGAVLDFPGSVTNASHSAPVSWGVQFKRGTQVLHTVPVTKSHAFGVVFIAFSVGVAGCNPADIATEGNPDLAAGPDNFLTGADFDAFIFAFFNEYRVPGGQLLADLTDGSGGGPDGFLTGGDFDAFLAAFFAGC